MMHASDYVGWYVYFGDFPSPSVRSPDFWMMFLEKKELKLPEHVAV